jgi:hypothetical protein
VTALPGGRRLQPLLWAVLALAVAVGVVALLHRNDASNGGPPTATATSPPPNASPTGPTCAPKVLETGFSRVQDSVWYGIIVENPCPLAAVDNHVDVAVLDATGRQLTSSGSPPILPVILPGQRLGVGTDIFVGDASKAAALSAQVRTSQWLPASDFAAWPRTVTVERIVVTGPDDHGGSRLSFTVRTDPPTARLCDPIAYIIARDRLGKIVYGISERLISSTLETSVRFPPDADPSRTEVSIVQGRPTFGSKDILTCASER